MTTTKRVRIAVAVDLQGLVVAVHLPDGKSPLEAFEDSYCAIEWTDRISIVEADVPLPEEPATVRGEVVDGE